MAGQKVPLQQIAAKELKLDAAYDINFFNP